MLDAYPTIQTDPIELTRYHKYLNYLYSLPFATETSAKRKEIFNAWISQNETTFEEWSRELLGSPDDYFIGIVHGSIARGHAKESSDLDGTILHNTQITNIDNELALHHRLSAAFPESDWGVTLMNVQKIIANIHNDDTANNAWVNPYEQKRIFSDTAMGVAVVFGPVNSDNVEIIDNWRKEVIQTIANFEHVDPHDYWEYVRKQWYKYYVFLEKRPGELKAAIEHYLKNQGISEERLPDNVQAMFEAHLAIQLPDFDRMCKLYLDE